MAINGFNLPARYDSPGAPMIRMREITKAFKTGAGETTVLNNIDVDILQGQFVGVVGRSGSGKSTLVNMITGVDRPTSGVVEVDGRPIQEMPESEMALWRGRNLGIVFQFFQLLPMLSLVENVMLPMDFCNMYSPASREQRALELLRRVGLEQYAHALPGAVAGGQQQSAAVARALANDPPILIADEPTGNLDSATAEQVMGIFEELAALGKTILMVTHDRTLAQRTNRLLLISDGELVNEALAVAFPEADHTELLRLSKLARLLSLAPGEVLPVTGGPGGLLYLVSRGGLVSAGNGDALRQGPGCLVDPLATRPELRAGEQGAELLALPRKELEHLLDSNPPADRSAGRDGAGLPARPWWRRTRRAN